MITFKIIIAETTGDEYFNNAAVFYNDKLVGMIDSWYGIQFFNEASLSVDEHIMFNIGSAMRSWNSKYNDNSYANWYVYEYSYDPTTNTGNLKKIED